MLRFSHMIGQTTQTEQIVGAVESDTVLERKAATAEHLLADRLERGVAHGKGFEDRRDGHGRDVHRREFIGSGLLVP